MKWSKEEGAGEQVYLLYGGKTGWLGGLLTGLLRASGKTVHHGEARLENREAIMRDFETYKPTRVLNAAGVTGRPNVDWCEDNKQTVIRTNVIGTLNLADVCWNAGIHCTLYATGCIFEYDDAHVIGGSGFTEDERANFDGSFYSFTKGMCEDMLRVYLDHLTVLRVRMPISDDMLPRNFITKIVRYDKVVDIPNSMTVLTELLPASLALSERRIPGIFNFTNPGAISHNECLAAYKKHVDPNYTWKNFTVAEQDLILKARRSNNTLNASKLTEALPDLTINEIHVAMEGVMMRMKANLAAEGTLPDQEVKA